MDNHPTDSAACTDPDAVMHPAITTETRQLFTPITGRIVAEPAPALHTVATTLACVAFDHERENTFAGLARSLPAQPGLVIEGIGHIAVLIFYAALADRVQAVAREPLSTMESMDPAVRKSWQIEPERPR
ncbi:hypothetical protein AMAG_19085 [Allomyces macrogynus ATCC 38327]|uniref:Uncharacterized protein n=1 Tax=Allomyces macrogynus (strain ATCC 38327) TaxID=578462 RepID=A0A0L0SN08_ALLM3|nr:hypothetical protein AMAG_19085 [Allomyces macrogynus ATCC 38327]|eukprot:KNE63888.1 hypothetical protein AMAG_19085 [Allomyces macrogynus ATCC 38327]